MISVQGLASLLDRIDKEQVTIAVDGSLYKHHPRLEGWMKQYISLLAPGRKVRYQLCSCFFASLSFRKNMLFKKSAKRKYLKCAL